MRPRMLLVAAILTVAVLAVAALSTCSGDVTEPPAPSSPSPPAAARARRAARPAQSGAAAASATRIPADSEVAAPPDSTAAVVVKVIEQNGAPIAGAAVNLHRVVNAATGRATPVERSAASGADGLARFDVAPGEYFARASSGAALGASELCRVPQVPGVAHTALTLVLRPPVRHAGTVVVDESGEPVPGAKVWLNAGGLTAETTTDANGRFEFAGVAFCPDPAAWVESAAHVSAAGSSRNLDANTIEWSFRLRAATVIRGRLLGPDGAPFRPVGETWIVLGDDGGVRITPGEDGRFEAKFAAPSDRCALRGTDFAPMRLPIRVNGPGVTDAGDLRLLPARRLRGRVVDVTGAPVPRVRVGVRSLDLGIQLGHTTTDSAGAFDLGGLCDGELEVATIEQDIGLLAGRRPDTSRRGVFAGGEELVIQQPEGNAVLVRFRDAANAELTVRNVIVRLRRLGETQPAGSRLGQNVHTVRLLAPKPGEYDVRVEADGYEVVDVDHVAFPEGRATPIDVKLRPAAR